MNLLKKIKFSHIVPVILLYMGINIGLKINEIYEAGGGNYKKEETIILFDTYDFDGTLIEFYQSSTRGNYAMMNGVQINFDNGYKNEDETKHVYIEYYNKRIIKQNNEIIEPVLQLGNHKSKFINIYEFDKDSEIVGMLENCEYEISITSSLSNSKQLNLDYEKLELLMKSWRLMEQNETFVHKKTYFNQLRIENNWQTYDFRFDNFNTNCISFNLIESDKLVMSVNYQNRSYNYEITEEQYNEFKELIKSST